MIAPPYKNSLHYGHGKYPYGRCAKCKAAACHQIQENGEEKRVCTEHLPKHIIFCPYMGQQTKLFSATERTVLGGGGAGGSKTYMGARLYLKQWQVEHRRFEEARSRGEHFVSKGHALFLRRTVPEVLQVISEFKSYWPRLDAGGRWSEKYLLWEASSGYKVQFGSCKDDNDWEKFYGGSYSLIVLDEARQFTVKQITELDTRIRVGDPVLGEMLQLYMLTNPMGRETKVWMRKTFVEAAPPETTVVKRVKLRDGRITERTQVYIPSNLFDNPALVADGEYEATLSSHSQEQRRALLENDWYVEEGSWIGEDWTAEHVIEPFPIPRGWHKLKSHDYGLVAKGPVHWYAVDPEGGMVCYRAVTFRGLTVQQVANAIRKIEVAAGEWDLAEDCSLIRGPADATLWGRTGEGAETRGEQLVRLGTGLRRAKNTYGTYRRDAADQIRMRLRSRVPDPFDTTGTKTVPALRFFKTTEHTVRGKFGPERTGPTITIPQLQADEVEHDVWDTKGDDHDCDALGYAVMSRPMSGTVLEEAQGDPAVIERLAKLEARRHTENKFPRWYHGN